MDTKAYNWIMKGGWKWIKNYRIWEANRKVFLYPENWIEPELRDDKSPFFKEIETEISKNLYEICRSRIYELAISFDKTLSMGIEYEACFEIVMDMLSVPSEQRTAIFEVTVTPNMEGIPYYKLSPLNQFITTIPGYVFYCLKNKLPDNEDLFNEAATLMKNPGFPRYLQEAIGVPVSQEVKGALWRPNILGWFRKRQSSS